MNREIVTRSLKVVVANAKRLLEDAKRMEEWESYPTAYSLSILSEEEFGKAFLLHLARDAAIPWSSAVERALRNHTCKQLVAFVLEHVHRKDFMELRDDPTSFGGASALPPEILDAIHIVVLEHFKGFGRGEWVDAADRKIHPSANRIARGILDREKQSGFYVHVSAEGGLRKHPGLISRQRCRAQMEHAERVSNAFWLYDGELQLGVAFDWEKVIATFQFLTGTITPAEFEANWWA